MDDYVCHRASKENAIMFNCQGKKEFFAVSTTIIFGLFSLLIQNGWKYYDTTMEKLHDYESIIVNDIRLGRINDWWLGVFKTRIDIETDEEKIIDIDRERESFLLSMYRMHNPTTDKLSKELDNRILTMNKNYKLYIILTCLCGYLLYVSSRCFWESCRMDDRLH